MIIVALGNPGKKFENTRHNAGFMAIDFFAKKNDFPEFTISKNLLPQQFDFCGFRVNLEI